MVLNPVGSEYTPAVTATKSNSTDSGKRETGANWSVLKARCEAVEASLLGWCDDRLLLTLPECQAAHRGAHAKTLKHPSYSWSRRLAARWFLTSFLPELLSLTIEATLAAFPAWLQALTRLRT